jgi:hypothetical protein
MVSIDGTDISGATIDGTDVQEITVDGDVVWKGHLFKDYFENRTIDNHWNILNNGGDLVEQNGVLEFIAYTSSDNNKIQSQNTYGPGVIFEADVKVDGKSTNGGYGCRFGFNNNNSDYIIFGFPQSWNDNEWYIKTNNGSNSKKVYYGDTTEGVWRTHKIRWQSNGVAKFYIDGSKVGEISSYLPSNAINVHLYNGRGSAANYDNNIFFDNLIINTI